jgi:peroxiredoxin
VIIMLEKSQTAPAFSAPNQNNEIINLSDYHGSNNVVLYFYPKDDTPGCTIEANQFTALAREFADTDTVVLGVSRDSCASHQAFIDKYGLQVELLADTSGELCNAYGVWQEKERNGVKKMGIVRSTFVINKDGELVDAIYGITEADGHAQQILDKVRQL